MKKFIILLSCWLILSIEFDFTAIGMGILRSISLISLFLLGFFYYRLLPPLISNTCLKKSAGIWFLLYGIFIFLSLAWNRSFLDGLEAFTGIFICFAFSYWISNKCKYFTFLQKLLQAIFASVILGWLLFSFNSNLATNPETLWRFKGIYVHSQRLSLIISTYFILIFLNKDFVPNRFKRYIILIILLVSLLLTKTRANTTFLIATLFFAYVETNKKYILIIPLIILIVIGYYFNITESFESLYQRGNTNITELSGRTLLWAKLIVLIKKKVLLGYGFGIFKSFPITVNSWVAPHAHNLWLMQLYETGIIGTLFFQFFLISAFIFSGKHLKKFGYSYARYIIVFIFFCSFTGLVVGGLVTPLYVILLSTVFIEINRLKYSG